MTKTDFLPLAHRLQFAQACQGGLHQPLLLLVSLEGLQQLIGLIESRPERPS